MHALFYAVWLAHLTFFLGTANGLPELVGSPGKPLSRDAYLALMGGIGLLLPLFCGPGLLALLRRMRSGGVNLPHAAYWFTGERRAASLQRLQPHVLMIATWITLFLSALHAMELLQLRDERWVIGLAGLLMLTLAAHTLRLLRLFPAPPTTPNGPDKHKVPDRYRRGQP